MLMLLVRRKDDEIYNDLISFTAYPDSLLFYFQYKMNFITI